VQYEFWSNEWTLGITFNFDFATSGVECMAGLFCLGNDPSAASLSQETQLEERGYCRAAKTARPCGSRREVLRSGRFAPSNLRENKLALGCLAIPVLNHNTGRFR
jgi:hypothetical protein